MVMKSLEIFEHGEVVQFLAMKLHNGIYFHNRPLSKRLKTCSGRWLFSIIFFKCSWYIVAATCSSDADSHFLFMLYSPYWHASYPTPHSHTQTV
jgi:hypothetical protein